MDASQRRRPANPAVLLVSWTRVDPLPLLAIQVVISLAANTTAAWVLFVPRLDALPRARSLAWTTLPHMMRHVGATILAPDIVSPALDRGYREMLAAGDIATAVLAIATVIALHRSWRFAIALAWFTHVFGMLDLLHNAYGAARLQAAPLLGAQWFVVAFGVPLMVVFHVLSLRTLIVRRA